MYEYSFVVPAVSEALLCACLHVLDSLRMASCGLLMMHENQRRPAEWNLVRWRTTPATLLLGDVSCTAFSLETDVFWDGMVWDVHL